MLKFILPIIFLTEKFKNSLFVLICVINGGPLKNIAHEIVCILAALYSFDTIHDFQKQTTYLHNNKLGKCEDIVVF